MKLTRSDIAFFILFFLLLLGKLIFAQDTDFSNNQAVTLFRNAANTGLCQADWRFMNTYRCQWRSFGGPYNTFYVGAERQFYLYSENLSGGLFFIREKSGNNGFFSNNIALSAAYHKKIQKNAYHFGVQTGYLQKGFDRSNITLPDQFDMTIGLFNHEMETGDDVMRNDMEVVVFNLGFVYSREFSGMELKAGYGINNLNIPVINFINLDYSVYKRYSYFVETKIGCGKRTYIQPSVYLNTLQKNKQLNIGGSIGYVFKNDPLKFYDFNLGCYLKSGSRSHINMAVFFVGIEYNNLMICVDYDLSISKTARIAGLKNSLELSLIWKGIYSNLDKSINKCVRF